MYDLCDRFCDEGKGEGKNGKRMSGYGLRRPVVLASQRAERWKEQAGEEPEVEVEVEVEGEGSGRKQEPKLLIYTHTLCLSRYTLTCACKHDNRQSSPRLCVSFF